MRKLLNRILSPLGYEIRRVDRFRERLLHLIAAKPIKIVQIGANDGRRFDDLYEVITAHRCAALVVEPLPDQFAQLRANYAGYPDVMPVNVAIHASAKAATIYQVIGTGTISLPPWASGIASFDRDHLVKHSIPNECIVACEVPCMPLMSLVREYDFLHADVLQIDVEGYDAEIVAAIDFSAFAPRLIKYESKNLSAERRVSTAQLLEANGYTLLDERDDTVAWRK